MLFQELLQGLRHLLFPVLCEGCNKPLVATEALLCLHCETYLAVTGYHHISDNETAMRLSGRIPFRHATSFAYFTEDGLLQHLVHGLKYRAKIHIGIALGKQLGIAIATQAWKADVVVPVPLHRMKKAQRGYNQSDYLAQGVAEALQIPLIAGAVIRDRFTESQTEKTREERISNVKDAFKVSKPELLYGKHVLLIDDVLTTGATLEACAGAVLQVPGVSVSFATLGIAN